MSLHNRKSLEPFIRDDVKFYDYQADGIRHLWNMKSFLLADSMGLGKSVSALTVFGIHCKLRRARHNLDSSLLIVCPVSLKENWANEIEKFTRFDYVILDGVPQKRKEQLNTFHDMTGCKILITNYEQIIPHLGAINHLNFDVVIADEAHYIKSFKAKRTSKFLGIRAERFFMLTGSPMLNNPSDLWPILHRIQPEIWGDYWAYVNRYCRFGGYNNKAIIGAKNLNELTNGLNQVMLRRTKEEVLDLPPVQYIDRITSLTPLQKKLYEEVVSSMILNRGDKAEGVKNDGVKFLRLKQICGTTATVLSDGKDESGKLDMAEVDAEELTREGKKIIVFTQFRGVLEAYRKRLAARLPDIPTFELHGDVPIKSRQSIVNEWSNVNGPSIILCMIQVAGVGLNMTAAQHMQFIDEDFVPMINEQAVARAHRIGSSEKESLQVFKYYAKDTVEDRVIQILKVKTKIFGDVVDASTFKNRLFRELRESIEKGKS